MNFRIRIIVLISLFVLLVSSCERFTEAVKGYNGGGGTIEEEVFDVPTGDLGDMLWNYVLTNTSLRFIGDPAFDKDRQTVYVTVGSSSPTGSEMVRVIAINGNGTKKWESASGDFRTGGCPVIGRDGTVYYHGEHHVYALRPSDGITLWTYTIDDREIEKLYYHPEGRIIVIGGGNKGGMAIIAEDGMGVDDTMGGGIDFYQALAIMPDNNMIMQTEGVAPDGVHYKWLVKKSIDLVEIWRVSLDSFALVGNNIPVSNNGDIFLPQVSDSDNGIVEVYRSGQSIYWQYTFDAPYSAANSVVGPDGNYIINYPSKNLVILSSSGSVIVNSIPQLVTECQTAVDAQGHFFLSLLSDENDFGVFDSAGNLLWAKNIGWTGNAPILVDNGVVLVTGERSLAAIQGYVGLASSYARPRGDNKNTGRGNY